jgi:tRNA(fMet)-specific endonuclease VapC
VSNPLALLDTNICIYLIEGLSDGVRARAEGYEPGSLVTSAVCYAEIVRGLDPLDPHASKVVKRFFEIIPVLEFDRSAADCYGSVPFRRHRFDRLIAAHALSRNLVLVTNNETDFADVPGLKVENWTAA